MPAFHLLVAAQQVDAVNQGGRAVGVLEQLPEVHNCQVGLLQKGIRIVHPQVNKRIVDMEDDISCLFHIPAEQSVLMSIFGDGLVEWNVEQQVPSDHEVES